MTKSRQSSIAATERLDHAGQLAQVLGASTRTLRGITAAHIERAPRESLEVLMEFSKEAARVRELVERRAFAILAAEESGGRPRKVRVTNNSVPGV